MKNITQLLSDREVGHPQSQKGCINQSRVDCIVEDRTAGSIKNKSCELSGKCRATFLMDFSPDRTKIASTHGDHTVRITEFSTGRCTHILRGHPRTPWCVSFHPSSNNILASGCLGGEVRIWDLLGGGSEVWRLDSTIGIASLTFHPTDRVLVFAASNAVYFWDWGQPEPFACCKTAHEYERVRMVRFDPYGHYLYTGIANNTTVQRMETRSSFVSSSQSSRSRELGEMYNNLAHRIELSRHDCLQSQATGQETSSNDTAQPRESVYGLQNSSHSPVHEEGLDYARQYAARVTDTTRTSSLHSTPNDAAITSHQAAQGHYGMSGISLFSCPPYSWPGTWSPPPRTALTSDHFSEEQSETDYNITTTEVSESSISNSNVAVQRNARDQSEHSQDHAFSATRSIGENVINLAATNSLGSQRNQSGQRESRLTHLYQRVRSAFDRYQAGRASQRNEQENGDNNRAFISVSSDRHHNTGSSGSHALPNADNNVSLSNQQMRQRVSSHTSGLSADTDCVRDCQVCSNYSGLQIQTPRPRSLLNLATVRRSEQNWSALHPSFSATQLSGSSTSSTSSTPSITISSSRISSAVTTSSSQITPNDSTSSMPVSLVQNPDRGIVYQMYTQSGSPASPSQADDMLDMLQNDNVTTYVVYQSNRERNRGRSTPNHTHRRAYTRTRYNATRDLQRDNNVISVTVDPRESSDSNSSNDSLHTEFNTTHPLASNVVNAENRNGVSDNEEQQPNLMFPTQEPALRQSQDEGRNDSNISPETNVVAAFTTALQQGNNDGSTGNSNEIEQEVSLSLSTAEHNDDQWSGLSTIVPGPSENTRSEMQESVDTRKNVERQTNSREDPESLQESFASITAHIEREMNELDRRITALRDSFNESLRALEENRRLLDEELSEDSGSSRDSNSETDSHASATSFTPPVPVITITRPTENEDPQLPGLFSDVQEPTSQVESQRPTNLLESALRSHERPTVGMSAAWQQAHVSQPSRTEPSWYVLQRHHLHPHYSASILDDTINRPGDAIQAAINRAIAGAFVGNGEQAVATNIINQTYRIQRWDFRHYKIPDISTADQNVIIQHCKLHNDASSDISLDATLLATFVPSHRGFPDDNILGIFSLGEDTLGHCLYTKSFGPNAISVSFSPKCQYAMVGLAAKRLSWVFTDNQMVAQVYRLNKERAGEDSMKHEFDVMHPCDMDIRTRVSVNSARWLPDVGMGLVYGTNRGDLNICQPGSSKLIEKASDDGLAAEAQSSENSRAGLSIRRNLMQMLSLSGLSMRRTNSIATQTTIQGEQYSAGTQTDQSESGS